MVYTAQITEFFTALSNTKESWVAILLFMGFVLFAIWGMYRTAVGSANTSAAGFQAMATNLAEDNRESNKQYRIIVEQFAELKGKFSMLEIEFKGVVVKLSESEKQKAEVLDKVDLITDEMVGLHQKLAHAENQIQEALTEKALTDQKNIELTTEVETLRALVDTLRREMVLLQSTSPTVFGDTDL